jgi:hypothetical protein
MPEILPRKNYLDGSAKLINQRYRTGATAGAFSPPVKFRAPGRLRISVEKSGGMALFANAALGSPTIMEDQLRAEEFSGPMSIVRR